MKMLKFKKALSLFVCIVLIAAVALFTFGCGDKADNTSEAVSIAEENYTVVGDGETQFIFTVTDYDGNEEYFKINTDKKTVGEALLAIGLIEGEEGPYGLYVKKVNGIRADYDIDGKYWAFYISGEYASSGVDSTEINTDDVYSMKVE